MEGEEQPERPASAGPSPSAAPLTDGYETLSFQDALTPSDADALPPSDSQQVLNTATASHSLP